MHTTACEAYGHDCALFRPADDDDGDDAWRSQLEAEAAGDTAQWHCGSRRVAIDSDMTWWDCMKAWDKHARDRYIKKAQQFSDSYAATLGTRGPEPSRTERRGSFGRE